MFSFDRIEHTCCMREIAVCNLVECHDGCVEAVVRYLSRRD
jgi:hypothetical protein